MKLITVFNNTEILQAGLLASHVDFLSGCELILIDNTKNEYPSFSRALHSILPELDTDKPIVIAHQDVQFYRQDALASIIDGISRCAADGYYFAGVAGVGKFRKRSEEAGVNPIICAGKIIEYRRIEVPAAVETIDECVIVTNKKTIDRYQLFRDEKLRWHLYAVDACISLSKAGVSSFVLPVPVNHFSKGALDCEYFKLAYYLLPKHGVREICTTNLHITKCRLVYAFLKYLIKKYNRF